MSAAYLSFEQKQRILKDDEAARRQERDRQARLQASQTSRQLSGAFREDQ